MARIKILIVALLALAAAGCTQNNGRIGRLFGSWVLEKALINGQDIDLPAGTETYFSFQADVVRVTLEEDHYAAQSRLGTFRMLSEEVLQLNFDHSDDTTPSGSGAYAAPEWLGFPAKGVFNLQATGSGDLLKLLYNREPDVTLVYYLTKTW